MKEIHSILGQRVACLRKLTGLSQAQLAEKIGSATETISRLETGSVLPSLARIAAVADALNIELHELFLPPVLDRPKDRAMENLTRMMLPRSAEDVVLVADIAASIFAHQRKLRAADGRG
jgi:transcriptional regulator with XRE-family HTH domain